MLSGPPLPLPHSILLHQLLTYARPPGTLGAWVRGSTQLIHLYETGSAGSCRILVDADLGRLLRRCERIVLRHGVQPVVLDAAVIIHWRALQVVTSTPHLPSQELLDAIVPGARLESSGFHVPIGTQPPECVLEACLTHGIRVVESRVVYGPPALSDTAESLTSFPIPSSPRSL
jgi:hypothetical protein